SLARQMRPTDGVLALIEDLTGTGDRTTGTDVAVIGAGTAGLVIAAALERRGLSVICLESGGWYQASDVHPPDAVVHTKTGYSGAAHGRFRCIGGTSTRWGGALIPCLARDVEDAGWPISYDEIIIYQKEVERLFGLSDGPYEFQDVVGSNDAAYVARMAKWPPFGHRNVFKVLEPALRDAHGLRIVLNATAIEFLISGCRLQCVTAHAPDGSRIRAQSGHFVLAAGAIETTRPLLLLSRQNPGVLREAQGLLGRNFHDHLSVMIGILDPIARNSCNRLFGFRFEPNGTMRKL